MAGLSGATPRSHGKDVGRSEEHTSELQSPHTRRSSELLPEKFSEIASGSPGGGPGARSSRRAADPGFPSRRCVVARERPRVSPRRFEEAREGWQVSPGRRRGRTGRTSGDRKSTRLNSSHRIPDALPSSFPRNFLTSPPAPPVVAPARDRAGARLTPDSPRVVAWSRGNDPGSPREDSRRRGRDGRSLRGDAEVAREGPREIGRAHV